MSFYIIVLIIAIIILILALTSVGLLIRRLNSSKTFPPSASDCPDYWVVNESTGSCTIPTGDLAVNVPATGYSTQDTYGLNPGASAINFTDAGWKTQGISELCAKKKWANKYSVLWSGVSNYNSCDVSS
jgi:hypothetical protein